MPPESEERTMLHIGLLHGNKPEFCYDLVSKIKDVASGEIEFSELEASSLSHSEKFDCDLIIDGISSCNPFYRAAMRQAELQGVKVINSPSAVSVFDNYYAIGMAGELGIDVPFTTILPPFKWKSSVRSSEYFCPKTEPDWQKVTLTTGLPAVMKPVCPTKGIVSIAQTPGQLIRLYEKTGYELMMLQEFIDYNEYVKVFVAGEKTRIAKYDPGAKITAAQIYPPEQPDINENLAALISEKSLVLCRRLGFDFNIIEWAIKESIPYIIDMCNYSPDIDKKVVGQENYIWIIDSLSELILKYAKNNVDNSCFA